MKRTKLLAMLALLLVVFLVTANADPTTKPKPTPKSDSKSVPTTISPTKSIPTSLTNPTTPTTNKQATKPQHKTAKTKKSKNLHKKKPMKNPAHVMRVQAVQEENAPVENSTMSEPVGPVIPVTPPPNSIDELNTLVTIGTGPGTSSGKGPFFKNSMYQNFTSTIYSAAQLGNSGWITSLALYAGTGNTWTGTGTDTCEIWMKETASSVFTAPAPSFNTNITGATLVYRYASTTPFVVTAGWNTYTFSSPFSHNNTNNLMVIFRSHVTTAVSGSQAWALMSASGSMVSDTLQGTATLNANSNGILAPNFPSVQLNFTPPLSAVSNPTPTNAAIGVPTNASLSWNAATNGYGAYHYDLNFDLVTPPVAQVLTGSTQLGYTPPSALNPNTTYYWQVVAHDTAATASSPIWSFTTSAGAAPNAPSAGVFASATVSANTLTFLDNATDETGFPVLRSLDGITFSPDTTLVANAGTGTVSFVDTGLTINTRYWYQVYATNSGTGLTSANFAAMNGWTAVTTPDAPGYSTLAATTVTLLPTYPISNPAAVTYAIYDSVSNRYLQAGRTFGASAVWQTAATWTNSIAVTGLTTGTNYAIKLKARNGGNVETPLSPAVYFTPHGTQFPYFQNWAGRQTGTGVPTGWSRSRTNPPGGSGNSNWRDTTNDAGATCWAYVDYYNLENEDEIDRLATPAFDLSGVTSAECDFNYGYDAGGSDSLNFAYSLDNGTTWNYLWSMDNNEVAGDGDYETPPSSFDVAGLAQVTLPPAVLGQGSVKFACIAINEYGSDIFVSNFAFYIPNQPLIRFSMSPVAFGTVVVNSTVTDSLYIKNTTVGTLHITNITATTVTPSTTAMTVSAGDSVQLIVTWHPTVASSLVDTLHFVSDAQNGTGLLPVNGTAVLPIPLPYNQNWASFSTGTTNPTGWSRNRVTGSGSGNSGWKNIAGTGTDCWAYVDYYNQDNTDEINRLITPPFDLTGVSAAECDFSYGYSGSYDIDSLNFAYSLDLGHTWTYIWSMDNSVGHGDAGDETPPTSFANADQAQIVLPAAVLGQPLVFFACIGVNEFGSDIFVSNFSFYALTGSRIDCNPTSLNFNNVTAGLQSSRTAYVRNSGLTTLNVSSITATTVSVSPTTMTIAVGDSALLTANWTPPGTGTLTDNIVIVSDATNNASLNVPVTGNALAAALGNSSFNPTSGTAGTTFHFQIDFGSQVAAAGVDSIRVFVGATPYLLSFVSGSIPGTATYAGDAVLSSVGATSIYYVATYHDGVNSGLTIQYPYPTGTIAGPNVLPSQTGGPDGGGYYYLTSNVNGGPTYNWIDISSTGTAVSAFNASNYDDVEIGLPMGTFSMPFYGTTHPTGGTDSLWVSTNGYLRFNGAAATSGNFSNVELPYSTFSTAMFPLWDDGQVDPTYNQYVWYQNMGDGRFVVQWKHSHLSNPEDTLQYEAVLYSSGNILFQYRQILDAAAQVSSTVGIQGTGTGTNWLELGDATFVPPANYAILFTQTPPQQNQAQIATVPSDSIRFGNVVINTTENDTVWVKNTGSASLNITNVTAPATVTLSWTNQTIVNGDSVIIVLAWSPTAIGALTGNLTFTSNAANGATFNVPLTGNAIGAPQISLSTNAVNYGFVTVGGTTSATVYIVNTGLSALNITNISVPTTVTPSFTTGTIAAGVQDTLVLTWNPVTEGAFSGAVVVSSNAATAPSDTITVSGYAFVAPGVPNISIAYNLATTTATVSWQRPAGTIDGYKVYRVNNTGYFNATSPRLIATVNGANNTSYIDAGVTGTEYYIITSFNAASSSSLGTSDVIRIAAPNSTSSTDKMTTPKKGNTSKQTMLPSRSIVK